MHAPAGAALMALAAAVIPRRAPTTLALESDGRPLHMPRHEWTPSADKAAGACRPPAPRGRKRLPRSTHGDRGSATEDTVDVLVAAHHTPAGTTTVHLYEIAASRPPRRFLREDRRRLLSVLRSPHEHDLSVGETPPVLHVQGGALAGGP